jgi:uncharacterized RmlC-like cupin family protein
MSDAGSALTHVRGDSLPEADHTPGMTRREAVARDGLWSGTVVTEPGAVSGWHHHGEHESTIYVVRGSLHMQFGPDGNESFDARAGDFVQVPPGAVHRESNPADDASLLVVFRHGHGEPTVNVDGPAPAR